MKVLVACEYSGIVRDAFRRLGHDAWSCDLLSSDSENEHHIRDDVRKHLNDDWDLMIAHPPCTHLASSGAMWFKNKVIQQKEAIEFVKTLLTAPIVRKCIENPVGVISTHIRKPDQIIQPWQFGDQFQKRTCLWLENLPLLIPTQIVDKGEFIIHGGKKFPKWYSNRTRKRDLTFPGIAEAMALQWGIL
jgi:hypothetical protein